MARIIRKKYPKVGSKYVEYQGIGSLYGNNNISNIINNQRNETITNSHDGDFNNY